MGTVERGNFDPNEKLLSLTEEYIEAIIKRFSVDGIKVDVHRQVNRVLFIVLGQVYVLNNDGYEASIMFAGKMQGQ